MTRRWIVLGMSVVVALIIFRVLTVSDPPGDNLERVEGAAYQLTLTRYFDGEGLNCQPFQLDVTFDWQPNLKKIVIFAEQADDVVIAQTPTTIYVFYNELVLTGFGGWITSPRDAKPLLCDINLPPCAKERRNLADEGILMQRVCGPSGRWKHEQ